MLSICQWIFLTPLSISIRESIWIYPILNVLHCVGVLFVAGTIVVVDLRLLGFGMRRSPVSSVVSQVLPWTLSGFAFMFVTGGLLAWSEPVKLYHSRFFSWKLAVHRGGRPQRAALSLRNLSRSERVGHGCAHTRSCPAGRRGVHPMLDLRDRRRSRGGLRADMRPHTFATDFPFCAAFEWIERSPVGQFMRGSPVVFPIFEIIHLIGLALFVGHAAAYRLGAARHRHAPAAHPTSGFRVGALDLAGIRRLVDHRSVHVFSAGRQVARQSRILV